MKDLQAAQKLMKDMNNLAAFDFLVAQIKKQAETAELQDSQKLLSRSLEALDLASTHEQIVALGEKAELADADKFSANMLKALDLAYSHKEDTKNFVKVATTQHSGSMFGGAKQPQSQLPSRSVFNKQALLDGNNSGGNEFDMKAGG